MILIAAPPAPIPQRIAIPVPTAAPPAPALLTLPPRAVPRLLAATLVAIELVERQRADERLHAHGADGLEEVPRGPRRRLGRPLRGAAAAAAARPGHVARHLRLPVDVGRPGRADAGARRAVARRVQRARGGRREAPERQRRRHVAARVAALAPVQDDLVGALVHARLAATVVEPLDYGRLGRVARELALVGRDRGEHVHVHVYGECRHRLWLFLHDGLWVLIVTSHEGWVLVLRQTDGVTDSSPLGLGLG